MAWRPASGQEVFSFYRSEFPTYTDALPAHITPDGPKEYAVAFDQKYPVKDDDTPGRKFIRRGTRAGNGSPPFPVFDGWNALVRFFQSPAREDPLHKSDSDAALVDPDATDEIDSGPVPKAVYYGVDHWKRSWPTVVDIDAKDIALTRAREAVDQRDGESKDDYLDRAGVFQAPPAEYPYRFEDIDAALTIAFDITSWFKEALNGEEMLVVYSGQGAHVYLLDDDSAHRYDEGSHQVIAEYLEHEEDYPIDPVVTPDRRRVMRLPYSLHQNVSRIVMPVENPDFAYQTKAKPDFLTEDD
jgi:hypothetical protein